MKSSGNSSAKATPASSAPARKSFALTGRSVRLDPRTNAVRPDIADVRLAEYVFAPHYAAPMLRTLTKSVSLRTGREMASETIMDLSEGEMFEVLEIAGSSAWGVAAAPGLVGYIDRTAIEASSAS